MFQVRDEDIVARLSPGYEYEIGLSLETYTDESGKVDCVEEGTRGVLQYHPQYTYYLCLDECVAAEEKSACACNRVRYQMHPSHPLCGLFQLILCPFDDSEALG